MLCWRHRSLTLTPTSACFRIPMICSSLNRLLFMASPPSSLILSENPHFRWTYFWGKGHNRHSWILFPWILALLFVVACGASAPPSPDAPPAEVTAVGPTATPMPELAQPPLARQPQQGPLLPWWLGRNQPAWALWIPVAPVAQKWLPVPITPAILSPTLVGRI